MGPVLSKHTSTSVWSFKLCSFTEQNRLSIIFKAQGFQNGKWAAASTSISICISTQWSQPVLSLYLWQFSVVSSSQEATASVLQICFKEAGSISYFSWAFWISCYYGYSSTCCLLPLAFMFQPWVLQKWRKGGLWWIRSWFKELWWPVDFHRQPALYPCQQ